MTDSIVAQLMHWLTTRRTALAQAGIEITDRLPPISSNIPWKATIGLTIDNVIVSYTVWKRTEFRTELIIVDGESGDTLRSDDATVEHAVQIEAVLDAVVNDLIIGSYRHD